MIGYDRDFLVPYLRNICALHLTERKLDTKISALEQKLQYCQSGEYNPQPAKKAEHSIVLPQLLIACVFVILLLRFIKWSLTIPGFAGFDGAWKLLFRPWEIGWMVVVIILGSVIGVGGGFTLLAISFNKDKKKELKDYKITYEKRMQYNKELLKYIPDLQNSIQKYKHERVKVQKLLTNAYDVNIIPRVYRGIYPSVYLYDWFSTSRATDLDHALEMFVLEQIKDKLDTIIANQSDMILNQSIMMAKQQQDNHKLREKLNRMIESDEERNRYLRMIESNTATTAYFSIADYIKKL